MKKDAFIAKLREGLCLIREEEREDVIAEYVTHIDLKMAEGKSEEEAIADFGDLDALIDEILDAYKIDVKQAKKESKEQRFNEELNRFFDECKQFIMRFTSLDIDNVVRLVFEFFIVLLIIWLLKIPVELIASLGDSLLSDILNFSSTGDLLGSLWYGLVNAFYVVAALLAIVHIMRSRLLYYRAHEGSESVIDDVKDVFHFERSKSSRSEEVDKREFAHPYSDAPYPKKASTIVAILVKLLLFIVALPFFFAMIALCFTSGVLMFMAMEGVILPGIWLLVIGGIVMCAAVIGALMHVVKGV
ncbi:DUF1700 domain-containing protein [Massilicoli timonensis]|uniref:DUF1700 domain-containing protein n=1 Tax=Massilicoli timonensis TaxID=2015901 RepID=UPI0023F1F297|nr:DUF1700 domain-containing protein [Massilicoli timonensis]